MGCLTEEKNLNQKTKRKGKSPKALFSVIPAKALHRMVFRAKAGIQLFQRIIKPLDSGFHRSDDFLRNHQK
jgi:hypothetical protein